MKLIKRLIIRWLQEDEEFRREVMEIINPQLAWHLKYGKLKNPPPMPTVAMPPH